MISYSFISLKMLNLVKEEQQNEHFDLKIDLLYSLLQPLGILLIASIIYIVIKVGFIKSSPSQSFNNPINR